MNKFRQYYSAFEIKLFGIVGVLLLLFLWLSPVMDGAIGRFSALILLISLFLVRHSKKILATDLKWLLLANLLYVLIALLSLINNQDWHEAGGRLEKYLPFLVSILLATAMMQDRQKLFRFLTIGVVLSAFSAGILAIYQETVTGLERVGEGAGLNVNAFGHIGSLVVLTLVGTLFKYKSTQYRWLVLLAIIFGVLAVMGSGSRGSLFAMLSGLLIMLIYQFKHFNITTRQKQQILAVSLIFIVVSVGLMSASQAWQEQFSNMVSDTANFMHGDAQYTSISARLLMWMAGIKTGLAHIWIGTGLGDTELDYNYLVSIGEIPDYGHSIFVVHNIFIDCFATTGILGLISMLLAVFIIPLWLFLKCLRNADSDAIGKACAIIGIAVLMNNFVYGITHSWLYIRELPYPFMLTLLLLVLSTEQKRPELV